MIKKNIIFWGKKINKNKKNIGIKWTGNKSHWNDKNRSIELNKIKSLFEISCEFHSLEIEYSKDDLVMKNNIKNLHCYKDELIDFEDTAALIENMDLIITVDVEGMEEDLLAGAKKSIEKYKPILLIEIIKSNKENIEKYLKKLDYKIFNMGMNILAVHEKNPVLEKIRITNNQMQLLP